MKYEVYFEINGKKLRTKVIAKDAFDAMNRVKIKWALRIFSSTRQLELTM